MKKNSTLLRDGQELIVNDHAPRVNDDPDSYRDYREAAVNDNQSAVDNLQPADSKKNLGANDDLALCNSVVNWDPNGYQDTVVGEQPEVNTTTTSIRPRPNKNDPAQAGSFVFSWKSVLWSIFKKIIESAGIRAHSITIKNVQCAKE